MNHGPLMRCLKRLLPVLSVLVLAGGSVHVLAQFNTSYEYALISYESPAQDNPVSRMQSALVSGRVTLEYAEELGYLESLLTALDIDSSSQLLVFSPTSLQHRLISPETPRALYFNDDTYIGFVQNSSIIEVTTIDERFGLVFYTFDNAEGTQRYFERTNQSCLVCHDSAGTMGGGVPMLVALSSVYSDRNVPLESFSGTGNVVDQTPIRDRWGGWYVTGRHGLQPHLGNILLERPEDLANLDDFRVWNLETLEGAGFLDTSPYLRTTSDIVALLVLEHQITVQNQITSVKFRAPAVLKRLNMEAVMGAQSWAELPEPAQLMLNPMLDKLVELMVFIDAAEMISPITGSEAFAESFMARGPADEDGRSLRELDMRDRVFRYPLSYLVYTDDFDSMPGYAIDYVYQQLAAYLSGQELWEGRSPYSLEERHDALEILAATKTEFEAYARLSVR